MPSIQDLKEQEYMALAPGVGVIPEKYRNQGYGKLPFEPGEGGLGMPVDAGESSTTNSQMSAFLAGVAAGADPAKLAEQLLGEQTAKRRR